MSPPEAPAALAPQGGRLPRLRIRLRGPGQHERRTRLATGGAGEPAEPDPRRLFAGAAHLAELRGVHAVSASRQSTM